MTTSVAVLGVRGYGKVHLRALADLATEGVARLVAVADPAGADGVAEVPYGTAVFADLDSMLEQVVPDVVVIATPIHTHLPLAERAMRAGCAVLVEKPTTATLAEFEALVAASRQTGRPCQIGFQSFGSLALPDIARSITTGEIGDLLSIGGVGTWIRPTTYYQRASWAGRRRLDGRDVVDGVVTNPLAHAVATGLRIAGARTAEDLEEVTTDLFHAHDIEADDTSAVRIRTAGGLTLSFGLALTAGTNHDPAVFVYGTEGELEFRYNQDLLLVRVEGQAEQQRSYGRQSLLRNMHQHLSTGEPLLGQVTETGAFMQVLEAVRLSPDPAAIPAEYINWADDEHGHHPVVQDVEHWCRRVALEGRTFTELGAPWAAR